MPERVDELPGAKPEAPLRHSLPAAPASIARCAAPPCR
jgi:hypothetical protein